MDRDINSETNRKDCAKDSIRDSVLLSRRLTELIYRSDSFVRHENKPAAGRENRPAGICDSAFTFPVLCDASLKEKELRIIDRPDPVLPARQISRALTMTSFFPSIRAQIFTIRRISASIDGYKRIPPSRSIPPAPLTSILW